MAEILASNVSAEFAQRRNDRIQELHDSQAVSTDQLDEIKTEYELSRLQLERAAGKPTHCETRVAPGT